MTDNLSIHPVKGPGWGNCPKCGWFYSFKKLKQCPMCRHEHDKPVDYQQPNWEAPGLE